MSEELSDVLSYATAAAGVAFTVAVGVITIQQTLGPFFGLLFTATRRIDRVREQYDENLSREEAVRLYNSLLPASRLVRNKYRQEHSVDQLVRGIEDQLCRCIKSEIETLQAQTALSDSEALTKSPTFRATFDRYWYDGCTLGEGYVTNLLSNFSVPNPDSH
jgi:hypothetical protein